MILNRTQLGARLRKYRRKRGLSQEMLSAKADCLPTYISHIEKGTKSLSLEMLVRISNALNISIDDLLVDSLSNKVNAVNREITDILSDCTDYETRIILDIINNTKQSIRENGLGRHSKKL